MADTDTSEATERLQQMLVALRLEVPAEIVDPIAEMARYVILERAAGWAEVAHAHCEVERLRAEVDALREVLVFAEGAAVEAIGLPVAALYAEDAPQRAVLQRAGCYSPDARPRHPGPMMLNPPPISGS